METTEVIQRKIHILLSEKEAMLLVSLLLATPTETQSDREFKSQVIESLRKTVG